MSTQNRFIVGLVSPGMFWLATSVAVGQGSPRPQGRPSIPAPASSSTYAVLLMSNGSVVQGEIIDDPAGGVYRLKTAGGQIPYPKTSVKRAGQSIEELYLYQVAALPPGDADERMKLVRWCLTQKLPEQAREQLVEVRQLCPDDIQAKLMAANLDANAQNRNRDDELKRTSGEVPADEAPAALPPGIAKMIPKHFGNALPEIFDLPPAMAVRRAMEFAEYVQPVLQNNCATCHNDKYDGEFQLVAVRTAKDRRNPDIARANLDAVLRLVNPDDPSRSDILAAGLVPHGGPRKGAIFRGANDRQYQILSTWVRSVRPKSAPGGKPNAFGGGNGGGEAVSRTGFVPSEPTDGFATDRSGRAGASVASGVAVDQMAAFTGPGAVRQVREFNESADFSGGKATDFPDAFDFNSPKLSNSIAPATAGRKTAKAAPLPALPGGKLAGSSKPGVPGPAVTPPIEEGPAVVATTAVQIAPGAVAVEVGGHPNDLPGMNQPKYPTMAKPPAKAEAADDDDEGLPGRPAPKTKKLDPALLEQMIKARNAGAP